MTPKAQRPAGEGPTGAAPSVFLPEAAAPAAVDSPDAPPHVVGIIAKRRDFLAASRARKWATPSMIVQARRRTQAEAPAADAVRVGYTCSKKVGNAVARNRAKRRLRAAVAATLPRLGQPGWDYVLIGRNEVTAARAFPDLLADLETALGRLHLPAPRKGQAAAAPDAPRAAEA